MKDIRDMEKLSLRDLEQMGGDERIPLPEGWHVQLPGETQRRRQSTRRWIGIAASVAVVAGIGVSLLHRPDPLKDTFDDPYLAYAALEQALNRVSDALSVGEEALAESQAQIDKINYWK